MTECVLVVVRRSASFFTIHSSQSSPAARLDAAVSAWQPQRARSPPSPAPSSSLPPPPPAQATALTSAIAITASLHLDSEASASRRAKLGFRRSRVRPSPCCLLTLAREGTLGYAWDCAASRHPHHVPDEPHGARQAAAAPPPRSRPLRGSNPYDDEAVGEAPRRQLDLIAWSGLWREHAGIIACIDSGENGRTSSGCCVAGARSWRV